MGLKKCKACGKILTTEQYYKGYDYCYSCYTSNSNYGYGGTSGLKKCRKCGEILTTEEYNNGYDYHLECYLEIKGK